MELSVFVIVGVKAYLVKLKNFLDEATKKGSTFLVCFDVARRLDFW